MTLSHHHHRGHAGTSFTKARCLVCRESMRQAVKNWTKQTTGAGLGA